MHIYLELTVASFICRDEVGAWAPTQQTEPAPKTTRDRRQTPLTSLRADYLASSDEEARHVLYLRRERCCERPNHCCGLRARKAVKRRVARRDLPGEASGKSLPPKCRWLRHPADARSERTRAERADVESDRRWGLSRECAPVLQLSCSRSRCSAEEAGCGDERTAAKR